MTERGGEKSNPDAQGGGSVSRPPPAELLHAVPPVGPAMIISFIAALGRNRVIGHDNRLPWRLPADFRFFKEMTVGKPIIMGRKTWESIGRPLPRRPNIVISRTTSADDLPTGVILASSVEEGLDIAGQHLAPGNREVMIIGGGAIYAGLLPRAHRLYLTDVDAAPVGDTLFPVVDRSAWLKTWEATPPASPEDSHRFTFTVLDRPPPGTAIPGTPAP